MIIVLCDVVVVMMELLGGIVFVEELIVEVIDFCCVMCKVDVEYGDDWFFSVWGLDNLFEEGIGLCEDWMLKLNDYWYGFGLFVEGFNMFDLIKVMIIMLGFDVDGEFGEIGILVVIVMKYLVEYGIIVEKIGLYLFFIMFMIGIMKGCWNLMVIEL